MQKKGKYAEEEKFSCRFSSGRMFKKYTTVIKGFDGVLQRKCF